LHFGLFAVGAKAALQFGGLGLMVQQPRTRIELSESAGLKIEGAEAAAVRDAAVRWFDWQRSNLLSEHGLELNTVEQLPVRLSLLDVPPRHQGLGTGTQVAFATALVLSCGFRLPVANAEQFAAALHRGKRSAIGTFGFFLGGLLVDRGKTAEQSLSPLDFRTEFPSEWPVVIFLDRQAQSIGLAGVQELAAFEKLPATDESQRAAMAELVQDSVLSGIMQGDYARFGEGLYQFGRHSGLLFEAVQSGAFQSQQVAELVKLIREAGAPAVGQSSWGPGVFAILSSKEQVPALLTHVEHRFPGRYTFWVTEADNQGAVMEYQNDGQHSRDISG
jgi:beta-RFAP synthase